MLYLVEDEDVHKEQTGTQVLRNSNVLRVAGKMFRYSGKRPQNCGCAARPAPPLASQNASRIKFGAAQAVTAPPIRPSPPSQAGLGLPNLKAGHEDDNHEEDQKATNRVLEDVALICLSQHCLSRGDGGQQEP